MPKPRQDCDDGRWPEKANFAQTCNLLSQFVKRRGSLRDLNLEIGGKIESLEAIVKSSSGRHAPPPALNSPTNEEKSAQPGADQRPSNEPFRRLASIDINVGFASNNPSKETATAKRKIAQLTMFYGGRVLIFDDYPEDRARELVALAKKGAHRQVGISSNSWKEADTGKGKEAGSPLSEATGSDMPIARRTSLHRFLEKRRDRAGGRGLYQIQEEPAPASSSKADELLELKL